MFRSFICLTVLLSAAGLLSLGNAEEPKPKYVKDWSDRDFTKRDFHGQDLSNHNMENCVLHFVNMKETKLVGSNLRGADFGSGSLDKADFTGCDLREIKFAYASAQNAKFDKANLKGADLSKGSVQKSSFVDADLRNVKGIQDLTGADFTGADLRGANLQDSKDYSNSAIFKNAKYDRSTRWPRGYDYESSGAVLVKDEEPK